MVIEAKDTLFGATRIGLKIEDHRIYSKQVSCPRLCHLPAQPPPVMTVRALNREGNETRGENT
jgi:hypothetical protein